MVVAEVAKKAKIDKHSKNPTAGFSCSFFLTLAGSGSLIKPGEKSFVTRADRPSPPSPESKN